MDMTWKSMLHEAVAASFEKDVKSFAVDSISYSCVDLPQARIRELSEKVLLLPHQGIVLMFSRYCFRLSSEEAEMFFHLKNAKGQFRFYSELLSFCMGLAENQMISDASFSKACKAALKNYLRAELKDDAPNSTTDKSRKLYLPHRKLGRIVAAAAITIALLFSTSMVANAQFREKVIGWVIETFEKYSVFELRSDGETERSDLHSYKPTYLPEGAELMETIEQTVFIGYKYIIGGSESFSIWIGQTDIRIYTDAENADIEPLDRDGVTGYFFRKDDLKYMCFERDGCFFSVYGSLDMEELIKIAAGITRE